MALDHPVPRTALATDTASDIEDLQVEHWRRLSGVEIAALVTGAYRAARAMAMAGLRERFPDAGDEELVARFAALTLGDETARRVYPEWLGRGRD
jgi:hypothetical protein